MVTQDKLAELLNEGVVELSFTKKDDSVRHMRCTTKTDLIPSALLPKGKQTTKSLTQVRVFDVDVNAWRSFNYDTLIDVKIETPSFPNDPLSLSVASIIILFILVAIYL